MKVGAALLDFIRKHTSVQCIAGVVTEVNNSDYTCTVKPADDGAEYHGVRLKPVIDGDDKGVILIPVVGSHVLIGILMNSDDQAFVIQCSNVSAILMKDDSGITFEIKNGIMKLNGDSKGGLPVVQEIWNAINRLEVIFNAHVHSANNTATGTLVQPATTLMQLTNNNVKHG